MLEKVRKIAHNQRMCETGLIIIAITIVFIVGSLNISQSRGIKVYGDEIGYWRSAALLNGDNWSGEAANNAFYGYGYGIILAPIYKIFSSNPQIMMQIAEVLQNLMLSSWVIAFWILLKYEQKDLPLVSKFFCIVMPSLYPTFSFFVKITMSEILISTVLIWICVLMRSVLCDKKIWRAVLIVILSIYLVAVHQRMMIVLGLNLLFLCAIYFLDSTKNKKKKAALIFTICFLTICFYILYKQYDMIYTESLYSLNKDKGLQSNHVNTSLLKNIVSLFFSKQGIKLIINSFVGKIYYALVSAEGIIAIAVVAIATKLRHYSKENSLEEKQKILWLGFILLQFMTAIGVAAIAARDIERRNDMLFYGRYSEYFYAPMIFLGVLTLIKSGSLNSQKILGCIVVTNVLLLLCYDNIYLETRNTNFWVSCAALGDLSVNLGKGNYNNYTVLMLAGLRTVLFLALLLIIYLKKEKSMLYMLLSVLMIFWVRIADVNWDKNVMGWYEKEQEGMIDITEALYEEDKVGFFDATSTAGAMQFYIPHSYFVSFSEREDIEEYEDEIIIITAQNSKYADEIKGKYEVIRENERFFSWVDE